MRTLTSIAYADRLEEAARVVEPSCVKGTENREAKWKPHCPTGFHCLCQPLAVRGR